MTKATRFLEGYSTERNEDVEGLVSLYEGFFFVCIRCGFFETKIKILN